MKLNRWIFAGWISGAAPFAFAQDGPGVLMQFKPGKMAAPYAQVQAGPQDLGSQDLEQLKPATGSELGPVAPNPAAGKALIPGTRDDDEKERRAVVGRAFQDAIAGQAAPADEIQGYKDGPKLPGVEWGVHDPTRPQPRIVETAGAVSIKPPADAKVLFDGTSLDAWTTDGGDAAWEIRDDVMIAKGKDIRSRESFGAIQLHFEWRIPEGRKVSGQGGGNSGVFLMDRYEVQVLQSHGNKTYPDGQAGSLYGQLPPLVNASTPQGEWESYDIMFEPPVYKDGKVGTPAKITVIHNGVVVQHGESFLGPTQHRTLASYPDNHPETGPLRLQFHGDPVEYQNFWVRPLGERDQAD